MNSCRIPYQFIGLREILEYQHAHGVYAMPTAGLKQVIDRIRTPHSLQEAMGQGDAQLLERFTFGRDEAAFEALMLRHGPMVLGVCRRLLADSRDVEDAFQVTFLVLVRKAHSIYPRERLANWLYGVAYRAAQKTRAATVRRQSREKLVRIMPEPASVDEGLWRDLAPLLDRELNGLPEKYRLPLLLCDMQGRTRSEAARQIGCPEGTVAGRLARARAMLAGRLSRLGLPVSGGMLAALLTRSEASAQAPAACIATIKSFVSAANAASISPAVRAAVDEIVRALVQNRMKRIAAVAILAVLTIGWTGFVALKAATGPAEQSPTNRSPADDKKLDRVDDAAVKELQAFQGEWKVVGLETDSQKASPEELKGMRWIIKGSQIQGIDPGETRGEKSRFKLNPSKNPKQIDLTVLEGNLKGKTIEGIYKFEKSRLVICFRDEKAQAKGRPKEFSADPGSDQAIIALELKATGAKPAEKGKPEPTKADAMEGKRWVAKGPDRIQLVGPTGEIGSPLALPRYRLEPGKEWTYFGEMHDINERGKKSRQTGEWRIWVVRANQDGSWRLVLRSVITLPEGFQGNREQKVAAFAWCDLSADGRLVEKESVNPQMDLRYSLAQLPKDTSEAIKGWRSAMQPAGQSYRQRLLPGAAAGECVIEAIREGPLDASLGVNVKCEFKWSAKRGLPEEIRLEIAYADLRMGRGVLKLGEVKRHDAAWREAFAADADCYFAAEDAYYQALARRHRDVAGAGEALEKAEAELKSARNGLTQPVFRERLEELLAGHAQQAKAVIEDFERRAALIGKPLADWAAIDLKGKPHASKSFRGKVVILDFWYRSCYWCVRSMPQVKEIAEHFRGQPVVVLGMNTDPNEEDANHVVNKMGLNYANLKAAKLVEEFKVSSFPTLIIIDQTGVVRDINTGYSPKLKARVVKSVERLLKTKR